MKSYTNTFIFAILLLTSCQSEIKEPKEISKAYETPATTQTDSTSALSFDTIAWAKNVITLLREKNFVDFSVHVHPEKGVRFSPYGYIEASGHRHLRKQEVKNFGKDSSLYGWGSYDGSGEEIRLTEEGYYNKFIYDHDYLNAPHVGIDSILFHGNSLINISSVYPEAHFVEFHFSGFKKEYEGMDWKSLRIIFEMYKGKPCIVGIIHDQWTI